MSYRILALMNEAAHVDALRSECESRDFELRHMRTIEQAMNWLDTKDHMDVIVSDVHLQNESVFDFLKRIKSEEAHQWIQFVLVCTNPSELAKFVNSQVQQAAQMLGADKYIMMHDFDPCRLLDELESSLPNSPPQKEQDPVHDNLGVPRPTGEMLDSLRKYGDIE